MRLAITGGPKTGKTTLAGTLPGAVIHGDDFIHLGWSESSAALAAAMRDTPAWIAEGVQVPRALRKLLDADPRAKPCGRLIVLTKPYRDLNRGQRAMAEGVTTVIAEILPALRRLGVEIEHR